MKHQILTFCAGAFLFVACNNEKKNDENKTSGGTTMKTEETAAKTEPAPDSATAMKNWQAYMTPGEPHKMLAKSSGTWNSEITWWQTPGAPAQKSTGSVTHKMIMGGRYQLSDFTGNMMEMPFEGMSTMAYDNAKKVFINTWIDNMGSGIMVMEGPWDEATKSINLKGKMIDPATGKEVEAREVFTMVDDNTQTMEMYGPGPDGKEFQSMMIKYTRKK